MRAMILAAGFGTRLLPYTNSTPKPLFTIAGRPVLDTTIGKLVDAGCRQIAINTHHLHDKIVSFVDSQNYPIPITIRHEVEILGTGGGMKNMADVWADQPFMVINSDIVTDIDLNRVYRYHLAHQYPATLVLHDVERFNTVTVSRDGFVRAFLSPGELPGNAAAGALAFTGIQVLDPVILRYIPDTGFYSSIDAYRKMISEGKRIRAFTVQGHYWQDIGTPESYRQAAIDRMAPQAFRLAHPTGRTGAIDRRALKGDGSDRRWYRLTAGDRSLIMADHGIRQPDGIQEVDACVNIGRHLRSAGIRVPEIFLYDTFNGLVFMEDLGDKSLQDAVRDTDGSETELLRLYQPVIRHLVSMSAAGAAGFKSAWAWQTAAYDRELILEKECRYFVEAFLQTYLGLPVGFETLAEDFDRLAGQTLRYAKQGFMHRDMQSRNIMVVDRACYFIDFQGGRIGPLQYDLASLLIDPYVDLPQAVRERLLADCIRHLTPQEGFDAQRFQKGYQYCCLTRNLQILGAFGFLSRVKRKTHFEEYIPAALGTLKTTLAGSLGREFSELKEIVDKCSKMETGK